MPHMDISKATARRVASYRQKTRRQGLTRLEVTVPRRDAVLFRKAAETVRAGGAQARKLRDKMAETVSLKPAKTGADLLAFFQNSPLAKYDIDLTRDKSIDPPPEF
jgi:hypothetical protein